MTDMQNLPKQTAELDKGSCAVWRGFTINTQEFADKEYYIFSLHNCRGKELIGISFGGGRENWVDTHVVFE